MRTAIAVAIGLHGAGAAAQQSFDVPAGCGSRAEFSRELERLLGDRAKEAEPLSLVIEPSAEPPHSFVLRMQLAGEARELQDPDCYTLFRSAIVVAAASVNPGLGAEPPPTSEAPPGAPSPAVPASDASPAAPPSVEPFAPVALPETNAPPTARRPGAGSAVRGSLAIGGGGVFGLLPGFAGFGELSGAVEHGIWGFGGALRILPGAETVDDDGRGVEVSALGGRVSARLEPVERLRVALGVEVHRLSGKGVGVREPMTAAVWSVAPALELAGAPYKEGPFAVELAVSGQWAVVRPRFQVSGIGEVYRVSAIGAAGAVRGVWHFP